MPDITVSLSNPHVLDDIEKWLMFVKESKKKKGKEEKKCCL